MYTYTWDIPRLELGMGSYHFLFIGVAEGPKVHINHDSVGQ